MNTWGVVVPWHRQEQAELFCDAWHVGFRHPPSWLVLEKDADHSGCAVTKNRGIARALRDPEVEVVVVLDDDCFPTSDAPSLTHLAQAHVAALEPQRVRMFQQITDPPSRGTPYRCQEIMMPVAASMGFWTEIGDWCAVRQLTYGELTPMQFRAAERAIFGRYFPLSGMNLAFRPRDWGEWATFIDVPRFDDIWMGWLWQREAFRRGCCFNLGGPVVRHARQSNVWRNLQQEALHLE